MTFSPNGRPFGGEEVGMRYGGVVDSQAELSAQRATCNDRNAGPDPRPRRGPGGDVRDASIRRDS